MLGTEQIFSTFFINWAFDRAHHGHPPADQSAKTSCSHLQKPARENETVRTSDLLRSEQSWPHKGTRQFEQQDRERLEWLRKGVVFEAQKSGAECQESPCYKALTGFTLVSLYTFINPQKPLLICWGSSQVFSLTNPLTPSSTFTGNLMAPSSIWSISDV